MIITPRNYFRTLHILFLALVMGQVVFAFIALWMVSTQGGIASFDRETNQLFLWVVPIAALAGIGASRFLFNLKIKPLQSLTHWPGRLQGYQSALLVRYALMEAPSLLALVCFLLTGDYIFLGISGVMILVFLWIRPALTSMALHLQLQDQERIILQDRDAVLYEQ